jgi:hypothetical protein
MNSASNKKANWSWLVIYLTTWPFFGCNQILFTQSSSLVWALIKSTSGHRRRSQRRRESSASAAPGGYSFKLGSRAGHPGLGARLSQSGERVGRWRWVQLLLPALGWRRPFLTAFSHETPFARACYLINLVRSCRSRIKKIFKKKALGERRPFSTGLFPWHPLPAPMSLVRSCASRWKRANDHTLMLCYRWIVPRV